MFRDTNVRNLDLRDFNTASVTDMSGMFRGCNAEAILFSKDYVTSNVLDMSRMFRHTRLKELDLSSFDTTNVKDFTDMFKNAIIGVGHARNLSETDKFNQLLGKKVFL